jgi:hypothetical protein
VTDTLIALATAYVETAARMASIRSEMVKLLSNGVGGGESADHHPPEPGAGPAKTKTKKAHPTKSRSRAATMEASAALDEKVMGLLRSQPMRSTDLAKAAGAKMSSTGARLHRLHQRGLIARRGRRVERDRLSQDELDLIDDPRKRASAKTVWIRPLASFERKVTGDYAGCRFG